MEEKEIYLMPQNQKSLYASVCKVFTQLMNDEIDYKKAQAAANLISQANSIIKTELARTALQANLIQTGLMSKDDSSFRLREIESKNFE